MNWWGTTKKTLKALTLVKKKTILNSFEWYIGKQKQFLTKESIFLRDDNAYSAACDALDGHEVVTGIISLFRPKFPYRHNDEPDGMFTYMFADRLKYKFHQYLTIAVVLINISPDQLFL